MQEEVKQWYENKKKRNAEYARKNTTQIRFSLNNKTDKDILDFLNTIDNKTGFFKELIRNYMKNGGE